MDDRHKKYRDWDAQQWSQEPVSPRDALPEDDLVFFLLDLIPQIDLSAFHQYYAQELRGQPPFDVTMMVTLLVYAYSVGVCSSRRIAAACERNLAFRAIVGIDPPDFRTISDFRKIHLGAFRPLFLEVLRLAGEMGMVKLGNLSTDGTKMGAKASRHKAMSYGYMNKEIKAWFKNARFRVTLGLSARTLIGPVLERVYASPWLPCRGFSSARTGCSRAAPASEHAADPSATPQASCRLDWGLDCAGTGGGSGRTEATSSSPSPTAAAGKSSFAAGC